MASFERKLEAFLDSYEQLKSVENEEAFLKEFMVRVLKSLLAIPYLYHVTFLPSFVL